MSAVVLPSLDNTLGAAFLGGIFATLIFGITCVQTYAYYQRFPKDSRMLRYSVGALLVLDALDLALAIHTLYFYMITKYGDPTALAEPPWSLTICILITAIINAIVSVIYAWRIYIISCGNWILAALPVIFTTAGFGFCFALVVKTFILKTFAELDRTSAWMLYTSFSVTVVSDVCITVSVCYFLKQRRTGVRTTDSLINRIMLYCVSSNLIASATALAALLTLATLSTTFIYIGIYLVLPKVYCNALLATLNSRGQPYVDPAMLSFRVSDSESAGTRVEPQNIQMKPTMNKFRYSMQGRGFVQNVPSVESVTTEQEDAFRSKPI